MPKPPNPTISSRPSQQAPPSSKPSHSTRAVPLYPPTKEMQEAPSLSPAVLSQTLATLTPTLALLAAFHHRNKNQHRLARWWSHLDRLRRHLAKFLGLVEARQQAVERMGPKARAKALQAVKDGEGEGEGDDGIGAMAGFIRRGVVPGAYLAFSQLTADRQFAHMGVFLLGVLAEVDAALAVYAADVEEGREEDEVAAAGEVRDQGEVDGVEETGDPAAAEMGVAVAREDVEMVDPLPTARVKEMAENKNTAEASETKVKKSQEKRVTTDGTRSGGKPSIKKKPRGDEFDDIFGSLDKPAKRGKKKKAKGDEFDDIFGGL